MNANSAQRNQASSESRKPAQDEWGAFDPRQAAAAVPPALQALREDQPAAAAPAAHIAPSPSAIPNATSCTFCCEPLLPNERYCSRCLRQVSVSSQFAVSNQVAVSAEARDVPAVASIQAPAAPAAPTPAPPRAQGGSGAMYTLESPARCPQCEKEIRTFRVLRVLRTQVSFTSTLPRKGYVIVCPECEMLLSAELSGLL